MYEIVIPEGIGPGEIPQLLQEFLFQAGQHHFIWASGSLGILPYTADLGLDYLGLCTRLTVLYLDFNVLDLGINLTFNVGKASLLIATFHLGLDGISYRYPEVVLMTARCVYDPVVLLHARNVEDG